MHTLQAFWKTTWRSVFVALGYIIGLILAGVVGAMIGIGWQASAGSADRNSFVWLFVSVILLGMFLGLVAARLQLTRTQHFILWGSLIIFNLGSVALEGAYFAPSLVTTPLPILLIQQFLATVGAALMITMLFARVGSSISWMRRSTLQIIQNPLRG
jgi:hypothetical protein